jgi:hypothetical protein
MTDKEKILISSTALAAVLIVLAVEVVAVARLNQEPSPPAVRAHSPIWDEVFRQRR